MQCSNFAMCPLCYGCKNYSTKDYACQSCLEDNPQNICKKKSHKPKIIAQMIKKEEVVLSGGITDV